MADNRLADVLDMDCIVSTNPLAFDLTAAFVGGARAILQRIVWRWCQLLGFVTYAPELGIPTPLLDIDGATFSRQDLAGLRAQLTKQAKAEDFVTQAVVLVSVDAAGLLSISAVITLTDAGNYSLEVTALGAINQLSGFKLTPQQLAANVAALKAVFGA